MIAPPPPPPPPWLPPPPYDCPPPTRASTSGNDASSSAPEQHAKETLLIRPGTLECAPGFDESGFDSRSFFITARSAAYQATRSGSLRWPANVSRAARRGRAVYSAKS